MPMSTLKLKSTFMHSKTGKELLLWSKDIMTEGRTGKEKSTQISRNIVPAGSSEMKIQNLDQLNLLNISKVSKLLIYFL